MSNIRKTTRALYDKACADYSAFFMPEISNPVVINGEQTTIYCVYKDKIFPVLVDTKSLPKLKNVKTWLVNLASDKRRYIVVGAHRGKKIQMVDLLLKRPTGYHIDHINRNTFDNRMKNLRAVKPGVNMLNKGDYAKNKTGTKNIIRFNGMYAVSFRRSFASLSLAMKCQGEVAAIIDKYSLMDAETREIKTKAI